MQKTKQKSHERIDVVHPNAAGIDVGSRSHFVAIGQSCEDVKEFGCYTSEFHKLCKWLQSEGKTDVVLESTGNYCQSLFVMLQDYKLNPIMNGRGYDKKLYTQEALDADDKQWNSEVRNK